MSVTFRVSDANVREIRYKKQRFAVDSNRFVVVPDDLADMFEDARPDWERIGQPPERTATSGTAIISRGLIVADTEAAHATVRGEQVIRSSVSSLGVDILPDAAEEEEAEEIEPSIAVNKTSQTRPANRSTR